MILLLETSTAVCSAALAQDARVVDFRRTDAPKTQASLLAVFVDDLLKANHLEMSRLQAVAVSRGPGSYTGLRVGVSTAKGLCFGADIPLLSVCSLQLIAQQYLNTASFSLSPYRIVPLMDARRMEVYTASFSVVQDPLTGPYAQSESAVEALVVSPESFAPLLDGGRVVFVGDGAAKCREIIHHPNAVWATDFLSDARGMAPAAFKAFRQEEFEDTAYFTPFYLKEFVAAPPKKAL